MNVETLTYDTKIRDISTNGEEAYMAIVNQLKAEITERQAILEELSVPTVKRAIIEQWMPNKRNIDISVCVK